MDPTQGENNPTPENRQPVFTPEPTPTPVAPTVEPAAGPMHPFFSNHPSQTFNTDAGDIILAGDAPVKPKLNKKPLIIGGIIAAVLVVVGVVVMVVAGRKNADEAVISAFYSTANGVQAMDEILSTAYYGDLWTEEFFNDKMSSDINEGLSQMATLSAQLNQVKTSRLSANLREGVQNILGRISSQEVYIKTLNLYNQLRATINEQDTTNLSELIEDDNETLSFLVRIFTQYVSDVDVFENRIKDLHCKADFESELCAEAMAEYITATTPLIISAGISQAVLNAYDNLMYGNDRLLYPYIETIISEVGD